MAASGAVAARWFVHTAWILLAWEALPLKTLFRFLICTSASALDAVDAASEAENHGPRAGHVRPG